MERTGTAVQILSVPFIPQSQGGVDASPPARRISEELAILHYDTATGGSPHALPPALQATGTDRLLSPPPTPTPHRPSPSTAPSPR
ncbi:hypothetical protein ACIF8W_25165 [Streptomyces sp. NPDC085639]|uniref:hypothetical protein n=1 Tax=Streptomyces sp. NPDC085639 TaxID=3365734 RepID=UPI0037CE2255